MDLKALLSDSSRRTADIAVAVAGNDPERFRLLLEFALDDEAPFSMRAARVINMISLSHPQLIRSYLTQIVSRLPGMKNDGLKRGMLKTLSEHRYHYDEESLGKLVDSCFVFLNDPAEKTAVKIYALDILYRTASEYPEIRPELIASIEYILPYSSKGLVSKGNKLLHKLYWEVS